MHLYSHQTDAYSRPPHLPWLPELESTAQAVIITNAISANPGRGGAKCGNNAIESTKILITSILSSHAYVTTVHRDSSWCKGWNLGNNLHRWRIHLAKTHRPCNKQPRNQAGGKMRPPRAVIIRECEIGSVIKPSHVTEWEIRGVIKRFWDVTTTDLPPA